MKEETLAKVMMRLCYGILFFFMCTILLRIFTRIVLVQYLKITNNAFINAIFFDQLALTHVDNGGVFTTDVSVVDIDWEELYPFPDSEKKETKISETIIALESKTAQLEKVVRVLTDRCSTYATDFLIGQQYFVNETNRMERLVGWDIPNFFEYNAVVSLEDGRLTEYLPKIDVSDCAASVIDLKTFCDQLDLEFLYVQSPYGICEIENADISNHFDFSNQNADELLELLQAGGVETLDMRQRLHEVGMSHADAFYRTDHHWKAQTGLWAAGNIAQYLNDVHDFSIDTEMLATDQFIYKTYPSWWLGSKGKKLTLHEVAAEDFTMIYPKYETRLHYIIPDRGIDETGDFSVIYDKSCIDTTESYSPNNFYSVYNHGDHAVNILENELCAGGKKILIIKDSFINVVNPFLACVDGIGEIDVLDLRHFTGSTKAFIRGMNPDLVIVWYNPSAITTNNTKMHGMFDFR